MEDEKHMKKMNSRKKKINKKVVGVIMMAALAISTIGGTLAYLTDNEHATNVFTYGDSDLDITGQEPNWDPDGDGVPGGTAEYVQPTETFTKDPSITNVGDVDAYAYIEVAVPVTDAIYVNKDGVRQNGGNAAHIELFEFNATGKTCQTATDGIGLSEVNDKWTQMYKKEMAVGGKTKMVYTYCYNEILKPGETTANLFDTITFANIIEGQVGGEDVELDVDINFYAIQALNTGDNGASVPAQAKNAYDKYANQNVGQPGEVINKVN